MEDVTVRGVYNKLSISPYVARVIVNGVTVCFHFSSVVRLRKFLNRYVYEYKALRIKSKINFRALYWLSAYEATETRGFYIKWGDSVWEKAENIVLQPQGKSG